MPNHLPARYFEIGCRIPMEYFWGIGWGESDVGTEIGSYDAALHMAGIENYNVMLYTSVLPPEAVELSHLPDIHHGSVLEGIIAVQHTDKPGTRITAGLLLAKVYRNSDGSYLGGFACEYAGNGSVEEAEANLREGICSFLRGVIKKATNSRLRNRSFGRTRRKDRSGPFLSASASPATWCRY
jgi:arginine decarboxylase